MKSTARFAGCIIALALGNAAIAAAPVTQTSAPTHGVPVKPYYVKEGDQAGVNNRLVNRASLNQKRATLADKEAKTHQAESQGLAKAKGQEQAQAQAKDAAGKH